MGTYVSVFMKKLRDIMTSVLCSLYSAVCNSRLASPTKLLFWLITKHSFCYVLVARRGHSSRLFVCSKKKRRLDSVHNIVVVCAVPFSRFDLFAAVVDKNDVTDQARSIKRGVSRKTEDFFCTGLAAQKAHFRQKKGFYRLSETPFLYFLQPGCYC